MTTTSDEVRAREAPAPEDSDLLGRSLDEDDQPRALWERATGWAIVAICTWLVFCIIDPAHHWTLVPGNFRFGDLFRNTTANGGDMGFIPENSLKSDPQSFEAVSKLKPGQYTNPLPVMDAPRHVIGYRILKLIAREPAAQRELSDPRVQTAIRQQLRERREQLLRAAYYEVVRNEAKIENYLAEDLLKNSANPKK